MYQTFQYETIALNNIELDERNPRIITQNKLSTQEEILAYLYEHEQLEAFIKKVIHEGKNRGAERPYVISEGKKYVVVEGNSRVAAYKVLTGLLTPPKNQPPTPQVSDSVKASLLSVDCSIAPNRDALLPIMAQSHFGTGDKNKWGYLGSRKAVYDEWTAGKSIPKLATVFKLSESQIRDLILEYQLYLEALKLSWSKKERQKLLQPDVAFNPPVRFLDSAGHKEKTGIEFDKVNMKVKFGPDAKKRFKHLVLKLVVHPEKGMGATANFDQVFGDFPGGATKSAKAQSAKPLKGTTIKPSQASAQKPSALFSYPVTISNGLIKQLMSEAKDLNSYKFPACATLLLRTIVEAILKHIIDAQHANKTGKVLSLEGCLDLALTNLVNFPSDQKKVLKDFRTQHLDYLNLGSHANVIPNQTRALAVRDAIDQFVKKHV
jgi:hypothetical protein